LEPRLKVLENKVLKRTSEPMTDEIVREWRKLHEEGIHNFYSQPNYTALRWERHVTSMGEK
jgi:hypothetical protein